MADRSHRTAAVAIRGRRPVIVAVIADFDLWFVLLPDTNASDFLPVTIFTL